MTTTFRRLTGFILLVTALCASTAAAQIDRGLAAEPTQWTDHAYGMSLTPPPKSKWIEQTDDGALIKFQRPPATLISVYIRKAESELDLPGVKDKALREFAFGYPTAVTMEQDAKPINVGKRDALGLFMLVPEDKRPDHVFAQVYTLIDPNTLVIFQLECDAQDYDAAFKRFKAMLDSVSFADPAELDRVRNERIKAGKAWLDTIDRQKIKDTLIPEQWLRITEAGKDVGYMRILQHDEAGHVPPGTSVQVNSRIVDGNRHFDTEAKFFEADDRTVEFWTIATTMRTATNAPQTPGAPPPDKLNWRQSGLRDGDNIEVSQETPTSIKKYPWKRPPFPYVSQVNLYILPALLPHDKPNELAFYSFNQDSVSLSLRTLRIEPLANGAYRVHDRPTPERPEQVSTYGPTGRLIEQRMTDGRVYLATTPQQLKQIWGKL